VSDLTETANKPNELLDLVNENDEIVGEVLRKDANSDPVLTHREVAVVIINSNNEVLLQKRSKYKTVNPLMWSMTAGHVVKGEDILKTAHTELQEELGFDTPLVFIKKELHKYPWETHFMYYYLGIYNNEKIILEPAEVEKVLFVNDAKLKEFLSSSSVNEKHLPTLNQLWSGIFNKQIQKLKGQLL